MGIVPYPSLSHLVSDLSPQIHHIYPGTPILRRPGQSSRRAGLILLRLHVLHQELQLPHVTTAQSDFDQGPGA